MSHIKKQIYDEEKERRPACHKLMMEGTVVEGIAIDDRVAVHFIEQEIVKILAINPQAGAYRIVKEQKLEVTVWS